MSKALRGALVLPFLPLQRHAQKEDLVFLPCGQSL